MTAEVEVVEKLERRDLLWRALVLGVVGVLVITGMVIGGLIVKNTIDGLQDELARERREKESLRAMLRESLTTQEAIQALADQTYADQVASHELLAKIIDCHERTHTHRQYERCRAGLSFDTRATASPRPTPTPQSSPEPRPSTEPEPQPSPQPTVSPTPCTVDNPLNGCVIE